MRLKEITRNGIVQWCPIEGYKDLFVVGSIAGAVDSDFSSNAKLEIYQFDSSDPDVESTKIRGSIEISEKFNDITWGGSPKDFRLGLIAGALTDGTIQLWDPSKIMDGEESEVMTLDKHTAPAKSLDFNPEQPYLASGGEDSKLIVWIISGKKATPFEFPNSPHTNDTINSVKWNTSVPNILASTSSSGLVVFWDVSKKRSIHKFYHPQKYSNSSIAWDPKTPTQLLIASDDDRSPNVALWDLRKSYAPQLELQGHSKGVLSVSWCSQDPDLVLTSGKDNKAIVWNVRTGKSLLELPAASSWMFDVKWSYIPSIFSTATYDGRITVYHLGDCSSYEESTAPSSDFLSSFGVDMETSSQPKQQLARQQINHVPTWMKPPVGAGFGFGGKLVTFSGKKVTLKSVDPDNEFAERSQQFENSLKKESYRDFCLEKTKQTSGEAKETWELMSVLLAEDAKKELVKYLGFETSQIETEIEEVEEKSEEVPGPSIKKGFDSLIEKCIMTGDLESAVECSIRAGRMDDALVIAWHSGESLWKKTREKYFEQNGRPFMKLFSSMATGNYEQLVKESNIDDWKQTLALIYSNTEGEKQSNLCEILASRLENEQLDVKSANICYMCAGNTEKTLGTWLSSGFTNKNDLQDLIEKVTIFHKINEQDQISPVLANQFCQYAELLANNGMLELAERYLKTVPQNTENSAMLAYRLFYAQENPQGSAPQFPFKPIFGKTPSGGAPRTTSAQATKSPSQPQPFRPQAPTQPGQPQPQPQPRSFPQPQHRPQPQVFQPQSPQQPPIGGNTFPSGQPQPFRPQPQPGQPEPRSHPQPPPTAQPQPGTPPQDKPFQPQPQQPPQQPQDQQPLTTPQPQPRPASSPSPTQPQPFKPRATQPPETNSRSSPRPSTPKKPSPKPPKPLDQVDISDVDQQYKLIPQVLLQVFQKVFSGSLSSADQRKKDRIENHLRELFENLNKQQVPEEVCKPMHAFCQALSASNYDEAKSHVNVVNKAAWNVRGMSAILTSIKMLMTTAKNKRL